MAENESSGVNRREFLRKAAITGAVAWAIPVVQSVAATPAYAQTSATVCVHSPVGAGNPSCKGACGTAGQAQCRKDCGGGCESVCEACICGGGNPCPSPDYCNPSCFTMTSCSGSCTVVFTC
jgi:hypothetical protein